MSTNQISSAPGKVTQQHVLDVIAGALDISVEKLDPSTKSSDISEWDSMGTLSILAALDSEGVHCEIGDSQSLQTVKGVLDAFRAAGKLE